MMADRMTAWQFLRWYAANRNPLQRGTVAATLTVTAITVACMPLMGAPPLHGLYAVFAGAALLLLWTALGWLALGSQRVQRWIIGEDPFGQGA